MLKLALAAKAKLLSELNKALAKDLQPRANFGATENCTVLFLSVALHVSIYLYSTEYITEITVA